MSAYIVTYDLMQQGQNYACITQKLKSYPTHWHAQGSVWIIETSQTAIQLRDFLSPCLDNNDKLFVAKLAGESAWSGYAQNVTEWLRALLNKQLVR